jgi:predicted transcriptional regulator
MLSKKMLNNAPLLKLIQEHQFVDDTITIADAIKSLQDNSAHCLLVKDNKGMLKGVFTEEDVVNKILGQPLFGNEPLTDFLDPNPLCLGEDSDITSVIDIMGRNNIRYIPICDKKNKPKGLFSIRELIYYLGEHLVHNGKRYVLKNNDDSNPLGHSQEEILEVMNLPIGFALSRYGMGNIVRMSIKDHLRDAVNSFKNSGVVAGLVFKEIHAEGLFRLRDIPLDMLLNDEQIEEISIEDFIKPLPKTVAETDTIGDGICTMANDELLFLHYMSNEKRNGLITARGLLAYMYAHIYDDE